MVRVLARYPPVQRTTKGVFAMRWRRRFLRAVPGLLLGSMGSAELAAADTPVTDPWQATGLDFTFIEQRVTTDACYRSETRFLSCMTALQRLLERGPRRAGIVLADDLRAGRTTAIWQRFGPLVLVEAPPLRRGTGPGVAGEVEAQGARYSAWREFYRRRPAQDIDFSALREWLLNEIVDRDNRAAYAAAAINGYLSIEDAHARIMPASLIHNDQETAMPGAPGTGIVTRYTGIGVALELIGNMPVVTGLIAGGPAERAGVRMHDLLLSVDGEPFDGQSLEEALNRLRGPDGTSVVLQFQRGRMVRAVPVVREEVEVRNVVAAVIEDGGSDWGYLRVHSFVAQDTCADMRRELDRLLAAPVSGLILDLRDNAGGRIDQAVCVADLFLGPNLVVLELRSTIEHRRSRKLHTRFGMRTQLPLVTLVNAGTGSASEVLAGALRDYRRTLLLGERTFGKGTIQTVRPWDRSGSVMKFTTTARYYLPAGASVQRVGIEPDIELPRPAGIDSGQYPVLRLGDLYPTSLPAGSSRSKHSPSPEHLAAMTCLSKKGGGQQSRIEYGGQAGAPDYPLYRAGELLRCMM
jgi:carboxyl-terminal processing protease